MIQLQKLTIQAFRGVPDVIDLDLSAPLSLIYAPNGTGKTTICEAAEWLLTGLIKRLGGSTNARTDIRCNFASQTVQTVVRGALKLGDKSIELARNLDSCDWRVPNSEWQPITQADLLEMLAPSAAEEGAHRLHANHSRQIWLRGTRFLSGEALAMLVNSDEDSLSSRQRLFADLLGVGHLLETERQLENYGQEIGQFLRRQQERLNDKDAEINDRQTQVTQHAYDDRDGLLREAWQRTRTAAASLDTPIPERRRLRPQNVLSAVASVRGQLEGNRTQWNQKRQAELSIAADWPDRTTLMQSLLEDQVSLGTISAREELNSANVAALQSQVAAATTDINRYRETVSALQYRMQALNNAQAQAGPLLADYLRLIDRADIDVGTAYEIVDRVGEGRARQDRFGRLLSVSTELPISISQRKELEVRRIEYTTASTAAPSPEAVTSAQNSLELASTRVTELEIAYERTAAPLDQLRSLAATAFDLGHDESKCPACSHDWGAPSALSRALAETARQTPVALASLNKDLQVARSAQQQAQDQVVRHNQYLARAVSAERTFRGLEETLAAFTAKVRAAGLDPDETDLPRRVQQAIAAVNVAPLLGALCEAAHDALQSLGEDLYRFTSVLRLYEAIMPKLTNAISSNQGAQTSCEQQRRTAQSALDAAQRTGREMEEERQSAERRIRTNTARVQRLQSQWRILAGDREWSDAALAEVSAKLHQEFEVLQSVEIVLGQTETLGREVAAFDELAERRIERKELADEYDRLNEYAEAALSVQNTYRESRQKHVHQQISKFVGVISALFMRMQCNLVYDDVTLASDQSWRATAEGHSLDPEKTFSQGQRQDFALSFFLARARGLGGTFILDEPLAHLDDLNRVALLDVFRAITIESVGNLSFVVTTANKPLVRHFAEKFARVSIGRPGDAEKRILNLIAIEGNPRTGINVVQGDDVSTAVQ